MVTNHFPPGVTHRRHGIIARQTDGGVGQPLGQYFPATKAEAAEEVVVAVQMAIKGRLAYTEHIGDSSERKAIKPFGVGDVGSRLDHPGAVEWPAIRLGAFLSCCHSVLSPASTPHLWGRSPGKLAGISVLLDADDIKAAWQAAITATVTMSSAVQPLDRS